MPFDAVALYTLSMFVAVLGIVGLSGYFPAEARPAALRQPGGQALVYLLLLVVLTLLVGAAWLAVTALPWTIAMIAAGLSVLFAPLAFQALPRKFSDSRAGVAVTVSGAMILVTLHFNIN
ncbi:phosphoglycerol transferase MdoB-like AlkP superfamily enzyme [Natronocella acetinitrilica]|uniref:Phosphoglycerol transferase MdoB-like AlkP superfamily enzyme n=1 Tax=Natronocella acetinitrilica TaxID=414046 RepID=A0AAE3KCG1_9GAMM|nr:hypothetical protein [Natronocella acetinitrilica]MCP1675741.1 phosphoglycerol transferase MdoB-like AlkP superfamily enzyme [Natronocella acetinitrilica]